MQVGSVLLMLIVSCPVVDGDQTSAVPQWLETLSPINLIQISRSRTGTKNIYGEQLAACGAEAGSSQQDGRCDEKGGGVHSMCVSNLPGDFSGTTGQGDWTESEAGKHWCVCIGAWSLYISKGKSASAVCDAIPGFVLGTDYLNHWNTWNGNELPDQVVAGVNAIYSQCSTGVTGAKLAKLKEGYCEVAKNYNSAGTDHVFSTSTEYSSAGC